MIKQQSAAEDQSMDCKFAHLRPELQDVLPTELLFEKGYSSLWESLLTQWRQTVTG